MTIEEFIEARLAEDFAAATGGWIDGEDHGDQWGAYRLPRREDELEAGIRVFSSAAPPYGHVERSRDGQTGHIEHFDPARALRDVEAKRQILGEFRAEVDRGPAGDREDFQARHGGILDAYRTCLRALASSWSDHPDYQPEWSPRA